MSISGSMFTASTALAIFGDSMAVIGHNIANLNTAGFKASRVEFADLLPSSYGEIETGHGARLASVNRPFQQGAIEGTSSVTDMAISGNGFFVVSDGEGGTFYTRAGQFHVDAASNLVNQQGLFLQGAGGNISLVTAQTLLAQATTSLNLKFNLASASTAPTTGFPVGLDASESSWLAASNFSVVATIYDSLGVNHDLTFLFRQNGPNSWDYRVVAPRSDVDPSAPSSAELREVSAGGTLIFDSTGTFNGSLSTISDINGLTWVGGTGSQAISAVNLDFSQSTQYGQSSALFSLAQDGWPGGTLTNIAIDAQGVISGGYSNGKSQILNTIQLATFANVDDLDPVGATLFIPTQKSGAPQLGQAGQSGRGNIAAGSLELSTVDLAEEFIGMIASQRAFQMNSKIITTADQMYAQAANLKE